MSSISIIVYFLFIIILLVMVGMAVLFNTFNKRKNQLIKQQLKAQLASQKKLHRSELRILQNQLNPHFVHNSLNAIQYFVQRNEVETSENYLSQFSKLMRLFFEYSRRKKVTLQEEKEFLENYLSMEQLRFEEKLSYTFYIDEQLDLENVSIPAMLLQPIVENAINHGIFQSPHDGLLEISFKRAPNKQYLEIQIADNGIGIDKSQELQSQKNQTTTSHSGQVLKERLEILNDDTQWDISYTITDRSATENTTGTRIILAFKNALL